MMSFRDQMPNVEHAAFPELTIKQIEENVVPQLNQWALANGLVMANKNGSTTEARVAPTTIYPTPIPTKLFQTAKSLQPNFNKLYATIANSSWLMTETEKYIHSDPDFTAKLYKMAKEADSKQSLQLGLFRSDYLIDKKTTQIKQVEFNTIACSFAGLSAKVGELHSFLNNIGAYDAKGNLDTFYESMIELPVSESSVFMTRGIAHGVALYEPADKSVKKEDTLVAFIVEPKETNLYDQKFVEYNLLRLYGIKTIRLTFEDILTETEYSKVDDKKRLIHKKTGKEISVAYYRTGYTVEDYYNEKCWEARKFIENSYAIKAPNLKVQLSGSKKIQQLLAQDEVISKFVDNDEIKKEIQESFVKIYPLDDSKLGQEGKKLALQSNSNNKKYVLKPQREGGGNNIYKEDIPKFLAKIDEKDWDSYILMELIDTSATNENYIVRDGKVSKEAVISELGIYGCIVFDENSIRFNEYGGSLLRTKLNSSDEGGVVAGYGCIDSICLVD